jgi:hypothetical protein
MSTDAQALAIAWWQSAAFRVNRWYALGIVAATLGAFGMPFLLGRFVPCAQFMEVEWLMVAILCTSGVGLLNIAFTLAPVVEAAMPEWGTSPFRVLMLVVVPVLVVVTAMWLAFSPFWYAVLNDPELLCD